MAVPFRRTSKSVKRKRRGHIKANVAGQSICSNCQKVTRPHHVCESCGYYKGKEIKIIED